MFTKAESETKRTHPRGSDAVRATQRRQDLVRDGLARLGERSCLALDKLIKEKMCGSPLYMAPEIMNNDVYNDQSDLWSVGLILYEMLYGVHPYESCKSLDELRNVVNILFIAIRTCTVDEISSGIQCSKSIFYNLLLHD